MADRKNKRSNLGVGVGSAANSTDSAYYHDNADGTFDEAVGSHLYYWTGSAWAKATAAVLGGTAGQDASTATLSNVSSSATNVTLLSANSARLGAAVYNDSTANLFVKFGATASSSSFTIMVYPGQYFEVPFRYTGNIDGIWASANGAARVTELTA